MAWSGYFAPSDEWNAERVGFLGCGVEPARDRGLLVPPPESGSARAARAERGDDGATQDDQQPGPLAKEVAANPKGVDPLFIDLVERWPGRSRWFEK